MEDEKREYLRQKYEQIQNSIVNVRSAAAPTSNSFVWTYRSTVCDVVSVITTSAPMKNGSMKEIKPFNKEMRRIKPPVKKGGQQFEGNPLEQGQVVDREATRKKMSKLLHAERDNFMSRLKVSRFVRTNVETDCATAIQKIFRGYTVRIHLDEIHSNCIERQLIRRRMREILRETNPNLILTWGQHRAAYKAYRFKAALTIQCAFRCYLSRKCISRKVVEFVVRWRVLAVTRIQCMARRFAARVRVAKVREKKLLKQMYEGATRFQTAWRAWMARRFVARRRYKMRWIAARIIQCWYRFKISSSLRKVALQELQKIKRNKGALYMQCVIRRFLARHRCQRIAARRLYISIHWASAVVQSLVRFFIQRKYVAKRKALRIAALAEKEAAAAAAAKAEQDARNAAEAKELMESTDIFLQARRGNTMNVGDLFIESGEADSPYLQAVDENGDSLLSIAAGCGHIDLVRKCLQWGFDISQRNNDNNTALMMAAKNGHLDIVKYFLYPPPALMEIIDPADMEISAEDAASLLVFAATQAPKIGTELIKMLLLFGLNKYLNIQQEETGMTALHAACEVGHLETVKLLLKGKADKMVMDEMGQTPLHKACGSSLECVQYLLGIEVSPTKGLMVRRMSALLDVGLFADAVDTAAKADVDDDELSISGEVDVDASAIQAATSEEKLEAAVQAAAAAELQAESEKVVSKSVDKEFVAMQLTKKDIDGKDCLLIAALAGKPDILAFAREFVPETKEAVVQIASRRASVSSHIGSIVASVDGTALSEDGSLDLAKSPSAELLKSSSQKDVETDAVPKIEKSVSQAAKSEGEDMGWTPNDIHRAFDLAISGPVPCLKIILDFGLDPSWSLEDDGVNMAMVVARAGRLEVLDLLLHKGMDFSAKDTGGRTVMHYAAMCKDAAVVAHLLTHEKAQACKIDEMMLTVADNDGATPLHTAARMGVILKVDLLARRAVDTALAMRDKDGMTPLLVACSYLHIEIVNDLIVNLQADASAVDASGNNALWHLFHPYHYEKNKSAVGAAATIEGTVNDAPPTMSLPSSPKAADAHDGLPKSPKADLAMVSMANRPIASELLTRRDGAPKMTREQREQEALRISKEITLVQRLLKAGCSFYNQTQQGLRADVDAQQTDAPTTTVPVGASETSTGTADGKENGALLTPEMLKSIPYTPQEITTVEQRSGLECGYIAAQEISCALLKTVAKSLSPVDCWLTVLAAIRFDDGACRAMMALYEGGAISVLRNINNNNDPSADAAVNPAGGAGTMTDIDEIASAATSVASLVVSDTKGSFAVGGGSTDAVTDAQTLLKNSFHELSTSFFEGLTLGGWVIHLGNITALGKILRRGYDVTAPADKFGNNVLHLAAKLGTPEMIDLIMTANPKIRLEQENILLHTAAMEGAIANNFLATKALIIKYRADARRALEGRYHSWILALARRRERFEKNLNTGRTEDDDSTYFRMDPDPVYLAVLQRQKIESTVSIL